MGKNITTELLVRDDIISILRVGENDYISLTDLARRKNKEDPSNVIKKWLSNYDTIEFIGLWEELNNINFNSAEFRRIKNDAPTKSFTMTPTRWKRSVNSLGIVPGGGKYSKGTFAHLDIALEFATWVDVAFKLYLIKEYERLKINESYQNKIHWDVRRTLVKTNYLIHTDAIKEYIVPSLTENQKKYIYANEADVLNVALFGMTAKQWREENPDKEGNIRDHADIIYLIVLSNLEILNSDYLASGLNQKQRLIKLNESAKTQIKTLELNAGLKKIEDIDRKELQ